MAEEKNQGNIGGKKMKEERGEAQEIGTVVSTIDGPSPGALDFVVNEGTTTVHRGQFVEMDYGQGTMVALVTDVVKTNRYFERAESVKEFENSGRKMAEQFPVGEWEYMLAKTRPLGVCADGTISRATYPPSPGAKVRAAQKAMLKKFLAFDDAGMNLGRIEWHDLDVSLNMSRLLKKHLAVLSISGSGKSHAVGCLIEELLDRDKEQGRMAVVVIDPHGEYNSFAEPVKDKGAGYRDYANKTKLIRAADVRIGVPKLTIGVLSSIIPGLSPAQKRDLARVLEKMQKDMRSGSGPFDMVDVHNEIVRDDGMKENTKKAMLSWIANLQELRLFTKTDSPSINDLVKPGQLTVVDLSELINIKKKQIIVSYFAQKLFNERRKKRLPPFLLVLEEAHQFVPESAGREEAVSRSIIRTIAREGRKFGASLCIVSQRPIRLDTTTLSQCNTHMILRITNPYDLKHIGESSEGLDKRSTDMITSLRVGEALLVGEGVNYPVFFKVRQRKSQPPLHEVTLEEAAVKFETGRGEEEKETEEFL